jgi:hypothetical protein
MGSTPILEIPYPDGTESADGPGAFQAIAERAEALGLYTETDLSATRQPDGSVLLELNPGTVTADHLDPYAVHTVGDFKECAKTASHGRWLLCDVDRDMTPAEIVAECPGLSAGDADLLAAELGTGASSQYGNAAGGKVKIPGYAGKFAIHPSGSHPKKGTGSAGGEESHVLTAAEAALKAHGHSTNDDGHTHLANDHSHGVLVSITLHKFATNQGSGATIQPYGDAGTVVNPTGGGGTGGSSDRGMSTDGTGVSVNDAAGADAAQAHNNLPPYRAGGHRFIYV